tara:strand:- start:1867 stop:2652 length:786 start_codon:yes stop_codon:yes gene_type:complete
MRKIIISILILVTSIGFSQDSEWNYLFDGTSLDGWYKFKSDKISEAWYIENGELILKSNNDNISGGNDILYEKEFSNFELSLEWKIPKGGNSGVFFNVVELDEVDAPWKTGPEIQILDNENFFDTNQQDLIEYLKSFNGKNERLSNYHKAPALYGLKPIGEIKYNPYGEWNHLILNIDHNKNEGSIILNGQYVYSFPLYGEEWEKLVSRSKFSSDSYFNGLSPDHLFSLYAPYFGKFKSGKIGLQDHGWSVRFRNIKIREL